LQESVREGKEEARKQNIPYTGFENDYTDRRNYCKQCGASFFHRVQGKLRCYDCGWALKNSEKDSDSEGLKKFMQSLGLGNDGSGFHIDSWLDSDKETTKGTPNLEKWLESRSHLFNPQGKKWDEVTADDIADVTDHPDFKQISREYEIEFGGLRVNEAAEDLGLKPNTLTKRISRQELNPMFHDVDIAGTTGNYFCIVTLNRVNHLKILGKATASLAEVLSAFMKEWKASEVSAIKMVRKTAKKNEIDQQTREKKEHDAVEGVRDAYQVVIGLFVPDKDGFGCTYFSFYGHQELIEAALSEWAA